MAKIGTSWADESWSDAAWAAGTWATAVVPDTPPTGGGAVMGGGHGAGHGTKKPVDHSRADARLHYQEQQDALRAPPTPEVETEAETAQEVALPEQVVEVVDDTAVRDAAQRYETAQQAVRVARGREQQQARIELRAAEDALMIARRDAMELQELEELLAILGIVDTHTTF